MKQKLFVLSMDAMVREDVAPTLAAILGQSLPEADGRVLKELLKDEK